jgi:mono/diheme cytochrome c family protein
MTMHRLAPPLAALLALAAVLALAAGAALAQTAPKGDVANGRKVYVAYGCHACHGYQGQGSNAGSKIAPTPIPFAGLSRQLLQPRDRMPAYSEKIVSDQEVADIYAYLASIPKAKSVAGIPLLGSAP